MRAGARWCISLAAAQAIPAPFDQAILGSDETPGRKAILNTFKALEPDSHHRQDRRSS